MGVLPPNLQRCHFLTAGLVALKISLLIFRSHNNNWELLGVVGIFTIVTGRPGKSKYKVTCVK